MDVEDLAADLIDAQAEHHRLQQWLQQRRSLRAEPAYDQGLTAGTFTMDPDGTPFVYPYSTARHFTISQVDFSSPTGREYFKGLLQDAVDDGRDGWMEDSGEYTPDSAVSADGTPGPAMHDRYVEQYHATAREFEETAPRPLLPFQRSGWTDAIKKSSIMWGGDPTPVGASTA